MTVPERLWAMPKGGGSSLWLAHPTASGLAIEYVRADLHDAEVERLREALVQVVNAASLQAAQIVADEALRVPASGQERER